MLQPQRKLFQLFAIHMLTLAGISSTAQQAPQRPEYDGADAPDVARKIHVDRKCRILPDANNPLPGKDNKVKPFADPVICSLESRNESTHIEERVEGNRLLRFHVRISEQTYVLQNITPEHVVFVVEQEIPAGWTVDSDPQPNRFDGTSAVFPVHAEGGQIVRLHVGMRHVDELKPRMLGSR